MLSSKKLLPDVTVAPVDPPRHKQHTLGHLDCPACAEVRAMLSCSLSAEDTFAEAASKYLQLRSIAATPGAITARYVRPNTTKDYVSKLGSIALFFGGMRLKDIRWFNMRAYQQARVTGDPIFTRKRRPHEEASFGPVKPQQANQEMAMLKRIKIKAGSWTEEDEQYFEYLQEDESDVQRALSPDEQLRWLDISRLKPRWELIYWWSIVAFDSLMSTNELRGLQIGNVNMQHRMVRVPWPAAKNKYRHRDIPIENPEVIWAFDRLLERAGELGAYQPMHYLFPFKITRSKQAIPERHMTESGIKKSWEEVREAANLKWFRPYDTRHTGATRMAEAGVPTEIIVARMGHCSDQMRRHYTHISSEAQRMWLRKTPAPQPKVQSISSNYHHYQWAKNNSK